MLLTGSPKCFIFPDHDHYTEKTHSILRPGEMMRRRRFLPGIDAIASGQIRVASIAEAQCRMSSSAKRSGLHRASWRNGLNSVKRAL
jgi:hypothetical protein